MNDDPQASLRRSIRFWRRRLGLTQTDVAKLIGVSRLTYNRMETEHGRTDRRRVDFQTLARICTAFDCSVNDLIDDPNVARAYENVARQILGAPT